MLLEDLDSYMQKERERDLPYLHCCIRFRKQNKIKTKKILELKNNSN